jgi:hypothetical protein
MLSFSYNISHFFQVTPYFSIKNVTSALGIQTDFSRFRVRRKEEKVKVNEEKRGNDGKMLCSCVVRNE